MQQLSMKKYSDEVFIKVVDPSSAFICYPFAELYPIAVLLTLHFGLLYGSEKGKRTENVDRDERVKKVSRHYVPRLQSTLSNQSIYPMSSAP